MSLILKACYNRILLLTKEVKVLKERGTEFKFVPLNLINAFILPFTIREVGFKSANSYQNTFRRLYKTKEIVLVIKRS